MRSGIEALRAALGWEGRERVDVVERRHLSDFLAAIDEDDPGSVHDEVPLTYLASLVDEPPSLPAAAQYGAGWLNGGDRFECPIPVRLGDTLRSRTRFVDVTEKTGRSGAMAILTFVTEFTHADGTVAARHVATRIRR